MALTSYGSGSVPMTIMKRCDVLHAIPSAHTKGQVGEHLTAHYSEGLALKGHLLLRNDQLPVRQPVAACWRSHAPMLPAEVVCPLCGKAQRPLRQPDAKIHHRGVR